MAKLSRDKGARGERELAALCAELGYKEAQRAAPMQAGNFQHLSDEPDVRNVGIFWLECKRGFKVRIHEFSRDLLELAPEKPGQVRVIAWRNDGDQKWRATLLFEDLVKLERLAYNRGIGSAT